MCLFKCACMCVCVCVCVCKCVLCVCACVCECVLCVCVCVCVCVARCARQKASQLAPYHALGMYAPDMFAALKIFNDFPMVRTCVSVYLCACVCACMCVFGLYVFVCVCVCVCEWIHLCVVAVACFMICLWSASFLCRVHTCQHLPYTYSRHCMYIYVIVCGFVTVCACLQSYHVRARVCDFVCVCVCARVCVCRIASLCHVVTQCSSQGTAVHHTHANCFECPLAHTGAIVCTVNLPLKWH